MKRIAVDIDGVLANLIDPFLEFSNPIYRTDFTPEEIYVFDFKEIFNIDEEEEGKLFSNFSNSNFLNKIQPIEGSQEAIFYLSKNNYLAVITARADYVKNQTCNWINNFFPNSFSKVHFSRNLHQTGISKPNKSDFCLDNNYGTLIEDDPKYANLCAEKGIESILINRPWNKCEKLHPNIKKVNNWEEVLEILK